MFKELTEEEFARRAAKARRVPVFKEFLADRETPVAALSRLGADEEAFLLESVAGGETRGRYSYLGVDPYAKVEGPDALEKLRSAFAEARFEPAPELPEFQGGAVGYVAYDAAAIFEPRLKLSREEGTPPMSFLLFDTFLIFDNVRDTVTIVVVADVEAHPTAHDAYAAATSKIAATYDRILSAESIARLVSHLPDPNAERHAPDAQAASDFRPEMTRDEFAEAVAKCKAAIRAGETIQIVPSQKFTAKTDLKPLALYRALRTVNPSPYNFMMRVGAKALVGSSPEELVKLSGRTASTAPIAGTRPRGQTPALDAELERELKADEKENAEHVMLVDLGRNDLGRVSETGSVKVESFAQVERYSHVMHLVSHVSGTLSKELDAFDLLRATFPAGTLTGAPKIRAMELIEEFEKSPRGVYGGAAGYFSFTGDMDFAIVIRTMVLENGTLTMRSGAGIVADSDPDREYNETLNKAKAVFEAAKFAEGL
jgi:anthranilate synthase component 1